jgi:hypothetical protein
MVSLLWSLYIWLLKIELLERYWSLDDWHVAKEPDGVFDVYVSCNYRGEPALAVLALMIKMWMVDKYIL